MIVCNGIYLEHNEQTILRNPISRIVEVAKVQQFDILNDDIFDHTNTYRAYNFLRKSKNTIFGIKVLHDLIFQYLDYTSDPRTYNFEFDLEFDKPCKELLWVIYSEDEPLKYIDMIQSAKIIVNGYNRFSEQHGKYFMCYQQYKYHTNFIEGVYVYTFNLHPESYERGSSMNFGKFQSKKIHITVLCPFDKFYKLKIYSIQYENLIVESGSCRF
jgi:hypothetical protein